MILTYIDHCVETRNRLRTQTIVTEILHDGYNHRNIILNVAKIVMA